MGTSNFVRVCVHECEKVDGDGNGKSEELFFGANAKNNIDIIFLLSFVVFVEWLRLTCYIHASSFTVNHGAMSASVCMIH